MKTGISTASLFGKLSTKDALRFFKQQKVETAEVFLQSFSEYSKKFARRLIKDVKGLDIHSMHILTTQIEPTLYSQNLVAQKDSFAILNGVLSAGKGLGAKNYTFHGGARFKKTPFVLNMESVCRKTDEICQIAKDYGISIAYENVHWGYYNYIGFFSQLKKSCPLLKATLDIKQARQSGFSVKDYIDDMGRDIVTVHLSDVDSQGNMCLPGRGQIDFDELFSMLKDVGFDGALLIEAYGKDYGDISELIESLNFINEKRYKIF